MRRYLFGFYKKDNMRFISHLDLQRLFKRCIKKSGIKPAYSQGFNPHEKINIVHPLSLGFETEMDYFELDSEVEYTPQQLLDGMNSALPEGIKFTFCREVPFAFKNSSSKVEWSEYIVFVPSSQNLNAEEFIMQDVVNIFKRDKKTKTMVEKDVKNWINQLTIVDEAADGTMLRMVLRSAPNETLNPVNLTEALCRFSGQPFDKERLRVCRLNMYVVIDGNLVALPESF